MVCPSCSSQNDDDVRACFTCGSVLTIPLPEIRQGALIDGRYEIRARLGKGGMGAVYRAYDKVLEEDVALKVLNDEIGHTEQAKRRFRSEIRLARKVTHSNVCRINEYGEDGSRLYIAMELVEGTDLKRLIRAKGPLDVADAFDVAIQVAKGLQAIHDVGIVHRDLKTPNLMLHASGVVKLMDFGIAKMLDSSEISSADGTATGHIVGTPDYMSPEQARGQKIDQRSDIYALGVVIWELFTGDVPFRSDTPVATILKHVNEPPPFEEPGAARLPPPIKPVLARALAKDPPARYQTAREFADALRHARSQVLHLPAATPTPHLVPGASLAAALPMELTESLATPIPTPVPMTATTPVPTYPRGLSPGTRTRARKRWALWAVATAAVAGWGWLVVSRNLRREAKEGMKAPEALARPASVPAFAVRVNALPWARVRLTPSDAGIQTPAIPELERTTPCVLELPEGEYFLELENGGLTPPLTERIRVAAGGANDFLFTLPSYDPMRAVAAHRRAP